MPRTTGAELVVKALEMRPGIRAIIVSGYADLPEGAALNVPRLAKPFTDTQLAAMIAAVAG
jgi:YesN/AraC family two-component response regulator